MRITGIIWLEDIVQKLWPKHHVEQYEAEETLMGQAHFRFVERGFRE